MILFKYCSVAAAINIIEAGRIRLQIPRYFNDPYDCLHSNFRIKFGYDDVKYLTNKVSARFRPTSQELQAAISKHNDVFDLSYFYSMSCFSEKNDGMLMWSHYARNHNGICLGFEFENDVMSNTKQISYVDENHDLNKLTTENAILTKYKDWSYEHVWRYIKFSKHSATRYVLGGINDLIKSRILASDFSAWELEKQVIWGEFLKDEENFVALRPCVIYLGCEFRNHGRMNDNIEYNKDIPVYDENKNRLDGVALITKYRNVEVLKLASNLNIPIWSMRRHPFKFKLEPLLLDRSAINKIIDEIEKVKFLAYKNIDVLKL